MKVKVILADDHVMIREAVTGIWSENWSGCSGEWWCRMFGVITKHGCRYFTSWY